MPTKKKVGTPEKKTFIGLVLDKSGSMGIMQTEIIHAFNDQKKEIVKNARKGGKTRATMVQFGGGFGREVEVLFENKTASSIPTLDTSNYIPESMTPMYDGIGKTLDLLEPHDDGGKDTAFLVVVFSDGEENASREWNSETISKRVKKLQKTGRWTFVYLGSNQDLTKVRKMYNISAGNTVDWKNNAAYASTMMVAGVSNYLSARSTGVTHTSTYFSGDDNK